MGGKHTCIAELRTSSSSFACQLLPCGPYHRQLGLTHTHGYNLHFGIFPCCVRVFALHDTGPLHHKYEAS